MMITKSSFGWLCSFLHYYNYEKVKKEINAFKHLSYYILQMLKILISSSYRMYPKDRKYLDKNAFLFTYIWIFINLNALYFDDRNHGNYWNSIYQYEKHSYENERLYHTLTLLSNFFCCCSSKFLILALQKSIILFILLTIE